MSSDGILNALQRLAQIRSAQIPSGGTLIGGNAGNNIGNAVSDSTTPLAQGTGIAQDPLIINPQLLSALNEMQHAQTVATGAAIVNQVKVVRESGMPGSIEILGAVTIDIVAMLFDFIFDNTNIPIAIKSLLSRLQIPVLKVAMLNPGFR